MKAQVCCPIIHEHVVAIDELGVPNLMASARVYAKVKGECGGGKKDTDVFDLCHDTRTVIIKEQGWRGVESGRGTRNHLVANRVILAGRKNGRPGSGSSKNRGTKQAK